MYYLNSGNISYHIFFFVNGSKMREKVGTKWDGMTQAKAMKIRAEKITEMKHGTNVSAKIVSFGFLADEYFHHSEVFFSSFKKQLLKYEKHIKPIFEKKAVRLMCDSDIVELQAEKITDGLKPSSINTITTLIKTILNFGVKRKIISSNPIKNFQFLKADDMRIRYLSLDEIADLKSSVEKNEILKRYFAFALGTGGRVAAILSIQNKDIDRENKILHLKDLKGNSTYSVPLSQELLEIIKNDDKSPNKYIVTQNFIKMSYGQIYRKSKPFLNQFNIGLSLKDSKNRVVLHTLRHTIASHLAIADVAIQLIKELLNHKDIKTTLRYAHLSSKKYQEAIEKMYKIKI